MSIKLKKISKLKKDLPYLVKLPKSHKDEYLPENCMLRFVDKRTKEVKWMSNTIGQCLQLSNKKREGWVFNTHQTLSILDKIVFKKGHEWKSTTQYDIQVVFK